jgi:hypothetical protein
VQRRTTGWGPLENAQRPGQPGQPGQRQHTPSKPEGAAGVTGLERGYRRLLYAYPAWYRRERGEEILDTLHAAAPRGRTGPSLRDSGALILGVRAGQNRGLTTATNLRLAVLLGVVLWLAGQISLGLSFRLRELAALGPARPARHVRLTL